MIGFWVPDGAKKALQEAISWPGNVSAMVGNLTNVSAAFAHVRRSQMGWPGLEVSIRFDEISRLLRNHHDCGGRVAGNDCWHNRCIHDTQAINPTNP